MSEWNIDRVRQYITDEVQENLHLDYKRAAIVLNKDSVSKNITKPVCAMANADGGIIIFGVAEFNQDNKRHLPEKLDPIDQTAFSKEKLAQLINNIQPRIDGVIIHPVPCSTENAANGVIYVVEIPKSTTAHQATDKIYYKRYNSHSAPMDDYEIRDIMNRIKHPVITINFKLLAYPNARRSEQCVLTAEVANIGTVYAKYIHCVISIPSQLQYPDHSPGRAVVNISGRDYIGYGFDNVDSNGNYRTLLPKLSFSSWSTKLKDEYINPQNHSDLTNIHWIAFADNAPMNDGNLDLTTLGIFEGGSHSLI